MEEKEKVYKTMTGTGIVSIVIGVVITVIGIAAGVLSIICGAKLLSRKDNLLF